MKPKGTIQITSFINLEKQEVRTQTVFNEPEADMKLYLELAGFMAWRFMEYTEKQEGEVIDYLTDYLGQCLRNYQETKLKDQNANKPQ